MFFLFLFVCFRLVFPVPVRELPYESMLTFHLRGSKQAKTPELLCWAALPLFNSKYDIKHLRERLISLAVFYMSAVSQMLLTHTHTHTPTHAHTHPRTHTHIFKDSIFPVLVTETTDKIV